MRDVMVVDDEKDIRTLISTILEDEGYIVRIAADSCELFTALKGRLPEVIILDIWLKKSKLDGIEILHKLVKFFPTVDVVMISGHGNVQTAVHAMQIGAYTFLEKPIKAEHLFLILKRLAKMRQLKALAPPIYSDGANMPAFLQGVSPHITEVRSILNKHSETDSRVLITGKQGTGKYDLAHYIHENSPRKKGHFVALRANNKLDAIGLEKKLFGTSNPEFPEYVGQVGLLERAHLGTIYLEHIDLYPHIVQKKLIKFLADKKFTRFMSPEKIVLADTRIIASISRNIKDILDENSLLHDLYVRLKVINIHMPDLRQRKEDIPHLVKAYSKQIAHKYQGYVPEFCEDLIMFLQVYSWQKNLRELRDLLELLIKDAYARHDFMPIELTHLPNYLRFKSVQEDKITLSKQVLHHPLREARENFEKEYLMAQLSRFRGNISKTAQFIGMERSALHRKLRNLDIESHRDIHEDA